MKFDLSKDVSKKTRTITIESENEFIDLKDYYHICEDAIVIKPERKNNLWVHKFIVKKYTQDEIEGFNFIMSKLGKVHTR